MHIIVCLDDKNGMMFNRRRQSSDRILRCRMMDLVGDGVLRMNTYSAQQFSNEDNIYAGDDFIDQAADTDYCFVENAKDLPPVSLIHSLTVYRWNCAYPADVRFPAAYFENDMKCICRSDFEGSSHKTITEETYRR
jgi:hypothetical protein